MQDWERYMVELVNVTLEVKDYLAKLTLNRPRYLNAIDRQTLDDLDNACAEIETRDDVRAVIISGAGRAFCSGADLGFVKTSEGRPGGSEGFLRTWHRVFNRIEDLPTPTIAAMHGYAFAGGLELAMCCDMRILADNATIGDQHTNYGLIPGGGNTQRLPRLIGTARAKELILTGAWLTPTEADRIGLVNKVVPADELMAAAEALAANLVNKSPLTARVVKGLVNRGVQVDLRSGLEMEILAALRGMTSEDVAEGLRAFQEKRQPVFKGR